MGKAVSDDGRTTAGTAWPAWAAWSAALVVCPLLLAVLSLWWPGQTDRTDRTGAAHATPAPSTTPMPPSVDAAVVAAPAAPSRQQAPGEPATAAPVLDAAGVRVALDAVFAGGAIGFRADSAQLTPQGAETARRVAEVLLAAPGVRVELAGHVGVAPGGAENALRLSEARAMVVHDLFVTAGVPAQSLVPTGHGDTQPKSDLVASRRVEIIVL